MNKKGAVVLHWILFGIIAAIGLFLYYSNTSDLPVQAPLGSWQLEMINSFLYKSELDLLDLDLSARETGWKVVSELAGRGGFLEQSSCGMEKGVNRWNIVDKWCLPDEKENLKTLFFQLFPNPEGRGFSPLAIAGQRIMSSGGMKTLKSTIQTKIQKIDHCGFCNKNITPKTGGLTKCGNYEFLACKRCIGFYHGGDDDYD